MIMKKMGIRNPLLLLPMIFLISIFPALQSAIASSEKCTNADSVGGDAQPQPQTWMDLYRSFLRYRNCDDGALAERYSEFVVYLLTSKWDRIGELNSLASDHPRFERFVLHHVDELMSPDQATQIRSSATGNCPSKARRFCGKLINSLNSH
jgi:hypothetical protein